MDVGSVGSFTTAMTQGQTADAVQVAVLKKAMDIEKQSAMQLISAATTSAPSNPPNLGNKVDTFV